MSSKLLHLKRLLHRRLQSRLSPSVEDIHTLVGVLTAVYRMSPPVPSERIRVQATAPMTEEDAGLLRREIASLVGFTQGINLTEEQVSVVYLRPESENPQASIDSSGASSPSPSSSSSRPARTQVVVTALNHGDGDRIDNATLSELCEPQSISWNRLFGKHVNIGWVNRDLDRIDAEDSTIICSSHDKRRAMMLYYPSHLQSFFANHSSKRTLEADSFVEGILSDHIDSIRFNEARGGGVVVPVYMPEWLALIFWDLARTTDPWLSFLTEGMHALKTIRFDAMECNVVAPACTPAASASIQLFFELERQQELIRRKIEKLERLVQCKEFVSHMELYTSSLKLHATELCEGIRMKQETPHTLDALCSQLSSLSMHCENCIDHALDAMQAVGEAPQGEEAVLQEQIRKILQARSAKQHVDKLKDKVKVVLEEKLSSQGHHGVAPGSLMADADAGDKGERETMEASGEGTSGLDLDGKITSAFEAFGCETSKTIEMMFKLQEGLEEHKEHQDKLVDYWLGQHEVMKGELELMLNMANAASEAESIGVAELQARFQKYMRMLEEHEEVEDTMLFPMLKSLFPQSAQDVDRVLDPERHKGVDMLNEKVGRLLKRLHERHANGRGMVLSAKEMKRVVDALESLNDYMVGHIRYEEEVTMPWLSRTGSKLTSGRLTPIAAS